MASISLIFLYFYTAYYTRKHCPNPAKKRPKAFSSGACSFLFVRQQIFHALALRRGGLLIGIAKTDNTADLLILRQVQESRDLLFVEVARDDRADAALPRGKTNVCAAMPASNISKPASFGVENEPSRS